MLPFVERLLVRIAASRPGAWIYVNVLTHIDRLVLPATGGRLSTAVGSRFHRHIVVLTTTGGRTGKPRAVPLLAFFDDGRVILIASRGGHARHPAWYHNLRARPFATVMVQGHTRRYRAREAEGPQRAELWRRAVQFYPGYADYQRRIRRTVPVMILDPAAPDDPPHDAGPPAMTGSPAPSSPPASPPNSVPHPS